jgi:hypothetical protein
MVHWVGAVLEDRSASQDRRGLLQQIEYLGTATSCVSGRVRFPRVSLSVFSSCMFDARRSSCVDRLFGNGLNFRDSSSATIDRAKRGGKSME